MAFSKKLTDKRAFKDETIELICESLKNVEVVWTKDGSEITSDERTEIINEGKVHKLRIKNITAEDTAEYRCFVGELYTESNLTVEGMCYFNGKLLNKFSYNSLFHVRSTFLSL